ncbi:MAG: hypothetical protein RI947_1051 [Candidatus Parcubacteria bacterium]|jgi:hypothetical protein
MKKDQTAFRIWDSVILTLFLVVALGARIYGLNFPLADFHSWRQADTAAVARNFAKDGFDLMHPRYDDLSSIQSGIENPQGYRFVEFPIYSAIFATLYKYVPVMSLEAYGRLVTALFSLTIIAVIYYLSLKESGRLTAIVAAGVYSIFPFFVFFSRVILPETTALAFACMSIFFLYLFSEGRWGKKSYVWFILSLIMFALSVLVKPPAVFYGFALLYLFIRKYQFDVIKKFSFYIFFIAAMIPFAMWRYYILQFPEGIPPSDWLITSVNTYEGLKNIFFRPAFFRWIFFERLGMDVFGVYLSVFFILGAIQKVPRLFLHAILFSAAVYLFVFQGGNVQHEYYQTILLPPIAIMIGLGVTFIIRNQKIFFNQLVVYSAIVFAFALSFYFSLYRVKDFYHYPEELPQVANIIKTLTKPDDKIVTDRLGDTTLLYLTERKGAPAIYHDPPELKKLGYNYLATLNKELIDKLKSENYKVMFENDKFALFAL